MLLLLHLFLLHYDTEVAPSPGVALAKRVLEISDEGRARDLAALSAAERDAFYRHMSQADYLALGRKALDGFGIYRARLTKQERLGGKLGEADVVDLAVREKPQAIRLDFVGGPRKGRRVLYNASLRADEMLARESGVLGFTSVWLSLDSRLARGDTNHRVTEVGFGPLIALMKSDLAKAAPAGGYKRADEGFDASGRFCMVFTAPAGAAHVLYASRIRFCVDAAIGVPLRIEVFDKQGLLERFEYADLRVRQTVTPDFFSEDRL